MSYDKVAQMQSRIVIGTKQTIKAMKNGIISEVYIARDANLVITQKVANLATQLNIICTQVDSMKKLGAACAIDVGASAVAIKKI